MADDTHVRAFADLEELSIALAGAFLQATRDAVLARGRFAVALSGGRTPQTFYRLLATEYRGSVPWGQVHLFWSDERFVPASDPASNFGTLRGSMLTQVPIPSANVHDVQTALDDPEESARRYELAIRSYFHPEPPCFDWMLLGLGEDGHVASLFPGSALLEETHRLVVVVRHSPKPPAVRLTMTLPLINAAREIHILVSGLEKKRALSLVLGESEENPPGRLVRPSRGSLHWWVDHSAYS